MLRSERVKQRAMEQWMTECEARNPGKFCTWARIVWLQPWFKGWWTPAVEGLKQTGWKIENPNWRRFYDSSPWDVHCTETLSNEPSISLCLSRPTEVLCKHLFSETLKDRNTPMHMGPVLREEKSGTLELLTWIQPEFQAPGLWLKTIYIACLISFFPI